MTLTLLNLLILIFLAGACGAFIGTLFYILGEKDEYERGRKHYSFLNERINGLSTELSTFRGAQEITEARAKTAEDLAHRANVTLARKKPEELQVLFSPLIVETPPPVPKGKKKS